MQLAQRTFVKQRARAIEQKMCDRFMDEDPHPIKVFSVSASTYINWLKVRQRERPILTPEMTGIPALRQFLLGLSADDNYKSYKEHVRVKLTMFLEKIRRISYNEKKDDAYVIIRPRFQQLLSRLRNTLEVAFDEFIQERVNKVWEGGVAKEQRQTSLLRIVSEWGNGVAWNTYSKVAREKGIVARTQAKKYVQPEKRYGSINWNEELSVDILPDIGSWKRRMTHAVVSLARDINTHTLDTCEEILAFITGSNLQQELKNIAVGEWSKHQTLILARSKHCEKLLRDSIQLTYRFATTETDIRCMLARVNWQAYERVADTPRGRGVSQAQRDRMYTAMKEPNEKGKTLIDRISSMVRKEAKKNLCTACDSVLKEIVSGLQLFDDHIDKRLPADYALSDHDFELRSRLKELLPQLETRVQHLGGEFSSPMDTDSNSSVSAEDGLAGPSKDKGKARREDIEDSTPAKKAKITGLPQNEVTNKAMHTAPTIPQGKDEETRKAPRFKSEESSMNEILWSNSVEEFGMRDVDDDD